MDIINYIAKSIKQNLNDKIFEIDFYGQIQDDYFEKNLQNADNLKYCGVLQPHEIIGTLKGYDALIFPSHYDGEGCPGILIEAMAAGLPIIASDWKYNKEFVNPGENGYLCRPFVIDDYVNAILELYNNTTLKETMGHKSLLLSIQYSHKHAVEILKNIFQ